MKYTLFALGLVDTAAGMLLWFTEGFSKWIGVVLLGKGIVTIIKSLTG